MFFFFTFGRKYSDSSGQKDEKILDFLISSGDQYTEADYVMENEIIEEYRDKMRRALIKIEDYFTIE